MWHWIPPFVSPQLATLIDMTDALELKARRRAARLPLDAAKLRQALPTWRRVDVVDTTGSTNADLLAQATLAADRTALVAANQSDGRGRLARQWVAPQDSTVAISALLHPHGLSSKDLGLVPLATGLAIVDALVKTAGLPEQSVRLKWPNDVVVSGRKICGILVEAASFAPISLVVGIGINVSIETSELPVAHATSLLLEGATNLNRTDISAAVLNALSEREIQLHGSAEALMDDYRRVCATIGQQVRAELPGDRVIVGTAIDVRDDGELLIQDVAGAVHVVAAGDISHLRGRGGDYAVDAQ